MHMKMGRMKREQNLGECGLVFHDVFISRDKDVELATLQYRLCVASHVW